MQFKKRLKPSVVIPGALVIAVLALSFAASHTFNLSGASLVSYGYGYGPGGICAAPPVQYHPITPVRILDTRNGGTPLGANATMDVAVGGAGGVPANATAAVINVTATNTTAASYLTVYPKGASRPLASTLNWTAGKTVPNLTKMALGAGGMLTVYNAFGNTDVVFDVNGYVSAPTSGCPADGLYNSLQPSRILDTRLTAKVAANSTIDVQVTGVGGVPAGAEAVTLNLTETNATAPSYITAYPMGASRPLASNVNFVAGQTVPNRVIVKLSSTGQITLYNAYGTVDLIADVNGWFTGTAGNTLATGSGDVFVGTTPNRILDTRGGGALGANSSGTLTVTGIPVGAHAAVLNVTVTNPTAPSYLTVWPTGASRPLASDLNFVGGLTVANLVIVKLGGTSNDQVDIYNAYGSVDVIADLVGWYQ